MVLSDGVEKFSCHYEADLDRSGRSVLDTSTTHVGEGWPVAGDNFQEGTYEIRVRAKGYALETGGRFVRMAGRGGGGFGGGPAPPAAPPAPVPMQDPPDVSKDGPPANIGIRMGHYMMRPHQK